MGEGRHARVLRESTRLLAAGVSGRVFPGAASCVAYREGDDWTFAPAVAGKLAPDLEAVAVDTPFDLASLTKSFVAVTALRLSEAGELDLEAPAQDVLTDIRGGVADGASLEALLTHRSGLAPWGGLYLDVPHDPGSPAARRWILNEAARRTSDEGPGACVYSDLGYMLAGEAIARRAGTSLDEAVAERVTEPLGIADRVYFAGALPSDRRAALARAAAPTERCEWRGHIVRGEVHDENCAALGGVSGHAGMFGSARGVARFAVELLDVCAERSSFLAPETLMHALEERPGGSYRLGFDVKSGPESAAGKRTSEGTFGHLGFTGTSFWCDPEREVAIVLLTNRVHPSRANEKIRGFRPAFHDGVLAAWDRG